MKLITTSKDLENEFLRLQNYYKSYYWLTAWAGSRSKAFENLDRQRHKIKKIVVGLHFYQTHPDFIEKFIDHPNIRYIKQPQGTFHPKLFLFYNNDNEWELLLGSANFTEAAFSINSEVVILTSWQDQNSANTIVETFKTIDINWKISKAFDYIELTNYRRIWNNFRPRIDDLSGIIERKSQKISIRQNPLHLVDVANMTWEEFIKKVKNENKQSLETRIEVLNTINSCFYKEQSFKLLTDDQRKFIAGLPHEYNHNMDNDWFGSMKGNGIFWNRICENNKFISDALDEIPLTGQITEFHYNKFIFIYQKAFESSRLENANNLATATRLLAMKRPDVFVCIDNRNRAKIYEAFRIKKVDVYSYWPSISGTICNSEWWLNPNPKNNFERKISNYRVAFLDSIYYTE